MSGAPGRGQRPPPSRSPAPGGRLSPPPGLPGGAGRRGRGPGRGRHRCFASGRLGGGGAAPRGLYKRPGARRCARLAAKIVPTCLRVPRRAGPPPGPSVPQGHAGPMAFPLVRAARRRLPPAGAGLGGARSRPRQLTVRAQPRPAPRSPPPRTPHPVSASPGRGAGHVPAGVGPRGGACGEGGQGASS